MLEVRCDCGKFLQLHDGQMGQMARCTKCKSSIRVRAELLVHRANHCLICDEDRKTRPIYIQLVQKIFRGRLATMPEDTLYVRCNACDQCFSRINLTYRLRIILIFTLFFFVPGFWCIGGLVIGNLLKISMGPQSNIDGALAPVALFGGFLLMMGTIPFMFFFVPFHIKRILSPKANRYLLSWKVIRDWSIWNRIHAYRQLPRGQLAKNE